MNRMHESGKFVVVEGRSSVGKSTLIGSLKERYPDAYFTREPGGTEIGEDIRHIIQEKKYQNETHPLTSMLGYATSRAQLVNQEIKPRLEDGQTVFLDRFWYSTYAYQGTEGVPGLYIWNLNRQITEGLRPDCVVQVDVPNHVANVRIGGKTNTDRYDLRDDAFRDSVGERYDLLRRLTPLVGRIPKSGFPRMWCVVDGTQSQEEVYKSAVEILEKLKVR